MGLSTFAKDHILATGALTDIAKYLSAHSANPGGTGTNEIAGGAPAYARLDVNDSNAFWLAPSGGEMELDVATLDPFDIPAGSTVAYLGLWDAVTAGNFVGWGQLLASETFAGQGTFTVVSFTIPVT